MKLLMASVILALVATAAAECSGAPYYICFLPRPVMTGIPGPEITGNYSLTYLYSTETRRCYPDPMCFEALYAVSRWDGRHRGRR